MYAVSAMNFTVLDWAAIVAYLGITLFLGLYFRSRSGKSVDDYFVSGRNVSWWLAGTSMVATTFAADTPLLVTGLVYTQGIAGNWLWWCFPAFGNDDCVSVCPPMAALRPAYRRAVCRDALLRKAGCFPARLPRCLSWPADELPDSGLGYQGHDQYRRHTWG